MIIQDAARRLYGHVDNLELYVDIRIFPLFSVADVYPDGSPS